MTPPLSELPRMVQWKIRRWEGHADYDDMLAQAYYEAWRSYVRAERTKSCRPMAAAMMAAANGPIEWQRSWRGREGYTPLRLQGILSLDALLLDNQAEEECRSLPHTDGFEAELVERLTLWQQVENACTPRQLEVLRLMLTGRTMQETADQLGLTRRGVEFHYYRALERCREALR